MKRYNRFISIILLVCMFLTIIPTRVLAIELNALKEGNYREAGFANGKSKDKNNEAKIIGEIEEKREKNVKYFLKEDMSYEAAIYEEPVHYYSEGKWKDIDNSFVEEKDEENEEVLSNKENQYKIKIAKNTKSKKLVKIKKDNYQLSWNIEGANNVKSSVKDKKKLNSSNENDSKRTLKNLSSTVEFLNIFPNIDLQYIVKAEEVKENIIINKKVEGAKFNFRIDAKKLTPKLEKDNSIIFYDENDSSKAVFKIEAPFMYDAKGEESKDVSLELKQDEKEYILTITPSEEWLNEEHRVYPVVIDPPVTTSVNAKDIKDTFVASNDTEIKYTNQLLRVGATPGIGTARSYIKLTLPSNITSSDTVVGATLGLLQESSSNGGGQINLHGVTQDWTPENLTWSNKPNYNPTIEDYASEGRPNGEWVQWDITKLVKDWYKTGNNYGLMLKSNNESSGDAAFYSSDWGDQYSHIRPQAIIRYVNNTGLEGYWTYHSQDVGRAGTGYVNDFNGNLIFTHEDLTMNGNRMPLTLKHVFNSNEKGGTMGYGLGWRLNLSQKIQPITIEGNQWYIYTDEDGTKHYFSYNDTEKVYKDETGIDLTLTKDASGNYIVKDKDGNELKFNAGGYLLSIKDKNNNTMYLSYEGTKLKTIKDGAGRETVLDILSNGYLVGITDPSGRKTQFAYNGIKLAKITYPDGKYSTFEYDSNNNLKEVINFDGYKISYTYHPQAPYPVSKVQEYGNDGTPGKFFNIVYGINNTSFIDNNNRKNIYQFNDQGNTVSINDAEGSSKYYEYGKDSNINKLTLDSKLQKFVVNHLKNHSAEASGDWIKDYWTGSQGDATFSSEASYMGNSSLKVTKSNKEGRHFYQQSLTLTKGKTYTFSGYVKTRDVSSSNGKGAALFVNYQDEFGNWKTVESSYVNGHKEWERVELKFTVPVNSLSNTVYIRSGLIEESGTAYFDSLQLEEGTMASRYNLVENANLARGGDVPSSWNKNTDSESIDKAVSIDGKRAFLMNGNTTKNKGLFQKINVSGKKDDVFSIGASAKGESIPLRDGRFFAIDLGIERLDGTYQWTVLNFNKSITDWQDVSAKVVADSDYKSVTFYALYYKNLNKSYFTNFQLYKEEFGQSYRYDSKGNLVSTEDLVKNKSKFEYNGNNDVSEFIDPKGSSFKYTYDKNRNVETATTAENVIYSFTYDSNGNPKTSKVGDASLFIQSEATYTDSGNYIKELKDPSGNTVTYNYNESNGVLNYVTDPNSSTSKTNYKYDEKLDRLTDVYKTVGGEEIARNTYTYENDRIKSVIHNNFSYIFNYDSFGRNNSVYVGNQKLIENTFDKATGNIISSQYGNGHIANSSYDKWDRITSKSYDGVEKFKYEYDSAGNLGYHEDIENGVNYRYIYDMANRLVRVEDSNKNVIKYDFDNNNNLSIFQDVLDGMPYVTKYMYDKDNKATGINYYRGQANNDKSETFPLNGNLVGGKGSRPFSENAQYELNHNGSNVLAAYESGSNLVSNSSFENGQSPWTFSDWSGKTGKVKMSNDSYYGSSSVELYDSDGKVDGSNTNTVAYTYIDLPAALTTSKKYTLSTYAKRIGETQPSLSLICLNASGGEIAGTNTVITNNIEENKWTRITETITVPAGTKKVAVALRGLVKDKDLIRFDNVQLEEKEFATFYKEGTSQGSKVLYDLGLNKKSGTMTTWFTTKVNGTTRHVIGNQKDRAQLLNIYIDSNNRLNVSVMDNGVFRNLITSTEIIDKGKWYFTALSWYMEGTTLKCKLYLNDKMVGEGSLANPADITGGITALGSSIGGSQQLNGSLQTFTYSNETLNIDEINALYKGGRVSSSSSLNLNYDTLGRVKNKFLNAENFSFKTSYTYEDGISNSTTNRLSSMDNNGDKIYYTYDEKGNIETITYNKDTEQEKKITYEYDDLNQLKKESNPVIGKTIEYSYDQGGNLLSKKEYKHGTTELIKEYVYTYGDTNWKDKLTNFDGKTITYDNIGNPLTYNGWTFTWENGRQLKSMTKSGMDLSFKYNDSGIRTEKTVNGKTTKYHLVGDKVTFETDGENSIYYTYDSDENLVSMNLNGAEYYYIRNGQGDITGLFDNSGNIVATYTYDSWGKLVSIKDGAGKDITNDDTSIGYKNPYRYRGYRYDSETGLYYLQSRYYNPEWGRFVNADALGGEIGKLLSHNVFAYCMNNPINNEDPSGYLFGTITRRISKYIFEVAIAVVSVIGYNISKQTTQLIDNTVNGISATISNYQTKSKAKTKSKTVANVANKSEPIKPKYWEADYNESTKEVDIGRPISQGEAILRVKQNKSILCSNATKALQVAKNFPKPELEINLGKFGEEGFYPHYHINGGHGDPHIWFFPGGN